MSLKELGIEVIDAAVSYFTPEVAKAWRASPYHHATSSVFKRDQFLDTGLEDLLAEMDAAGVRRGMLGAIDCQYLQRPNEAIARVAQQHPDRLIGLAGVDPEKGMRGVRELERAVRDLGLRGLRLIPFVYKKPPNANVYYPLYAKCVELDIPVQIQVGHTAPLLPSEVGRPIYLDEVALHFPELRIIGYHSGWPWIDEMIAIAMKHPNVYIDTSAHYPRYYAPQLLHFLKTFGRDKMIFASSFPLTSQQRIMRELEELQLEPEVYRKFLHDNAVKVWKLAP